MRRAEFLFAVGCNHDVDGQLAVNGDDSLERVEESTLRTFLIGSAASHQYLAERVVNQLRIERRARPVVRVYGLHVIH